MQNMSHNWQLLFCAPMWPSNHMIKYHEDKIITLFKPRTYHSRAQVLCQMGRSQINLQPNQVNSNEMLN